ncbi:hypothetical protein [Isoptericola sp. 178]|uniref:hypothetical protein n=1 Tax=Isoptericola sp. 178 TaxID=3064651 RepID=UPI0027135728|nr:hypothetical protein [Isoptericola sp. 178]MDO8145300.1 hypothetical protein [Isoptericola sp. 178]
MQLVVAADEAEADPHDPVGFEQHSRDRTVEAIDRLGEVWDIAVDRLTALATATREAAERSPFQLESIQFNVGIEAGVVIGLVTKADASVSLTFTRRNPDAVG